MSIDCATPIDTILTPESRSLVAAALAMSFPLMCVPLVGFPSVRMIATFGEPGRSPVALAPNIQVRARISACAVFVSSSRNGN